MMIPAAFVHETTTREGERGAAWLADLPGIVDELQKRWDLVPDGEVTHGRVGVIVPVQDAVLKVSFPHPGNDHEPDAFESWAGRGAVKLYERADDCYAMLLERVHPSTLAESDEDICAAAGQLSRRLAIPAPEGLPRMVDQADAWEEELRKDAFEFDQELPGPTVDAALAVIDDLARDQPELLIHGDFHPRNILRADREPWLAVDPKGYVGDPAYDGATMLKVRAADLHATGRFGPDDLLKQLQHELAVYAEAAGVDPVRVRRWVQLQMVQGAYWGRRHGFGRARSGSGLDDLVALADQLAVTLAT
ncbi:aminoglycoside phosphotransferase family protein [Kribbella sp. NPDC051952]|uniref:aminoglycoside phosphotransferase family protein n=1 Tax=Kribbella sp. NPDC051952 TaxID=3154851 RepID=UPI00343DEE50